MKKRTRITNVEKVILATVLAFLVVGTIGIVNTANSIKSAGGFKQVIIDIGRGVKDINSEINKKDNL